MKTLLQYFTSLAKSYRPLILPYIGVSTLFTASCIFFMTTISVFSLLIPFSITLSSLMVMHALLWTIGHVGILPARFLPERDISFDKSSAAKKFFVSTPSSCLQVESDGWIQADNVVVIGFNPNAGSFGFNSDIPKFSTTGTYTKVRFQYRGVQESTGDFASEKDLIEDGAAVILAILAKNVKPENIILYGLSLGGAVATLSLAHLIKTKPECTAIKLVSDRSFSSISAVLGPYMGTLLYPVLKILNLNFDAGYAWQHELKDVHKVCFYAQADEVISNYGSLKNKVLNDKEIRKLPDFANHMVPLKCLQQSATLFHTQHWLKKPESLSTLFKNKTA